MSTSAWMQSCETFWSWLRVLCWGTNHLCNLITLWRIPVFVDLVWASLCYQDGYRGYFGHVFEGSTTVCNLWRVRVQQWCCQWGIIQTHTHTNTQCWWWVEYCWWWRMIIVRTTISIYWRKVHTVKPLPLSRHKKPFFSPHIHICTSTIICLKHTGCFFRSVYWSPLNEDVCVSTWVDNCVSSVTFMPSEKFCTVITSGEKNNWLSCDSWLQWLKYFSQIEPNLTI